MSLAEPVPVSDLAQSALSPTPLFWVDLFLYFNAYFPRSPCASSHPR